MTSFARHNPATVLVVEHEAVVRRELADWLEEKGLIALQAADADEAIASLSVNPQIAVLVTNIKMPGSMDGVRLARYVRGRWPPLKIIFVSGMLDTPQSELPYDSFFIPKPYDHQKLLDAVAHWAGASQSRPAPPA